MVKVLEKPKPQPKEIRCKNKNCKALLEYMEREVKQADKHCIDNSITRSFYITCPECKKDVIIRQEEH